MTCSKSTYHSPHTRCEPSQKILLKKIINIYLQLFFSKLECALSRFLFMEITDAALMSTFLILIQQQQQQQEQQKPLLLKIWLSCIALLIQITRRYGKINRVNHKLGLPQISRYLSCWWKQFSSNPNIWFQGSFIQDSFSVVTKTHY